METLEPTTILHTQEVRGSSPCAPTIHISELQVPQSVGGSVCDVDCDVTAQFTFPTAG
jgi:hypothetical protein